MVAPVEMANQNELEQQSNEECSGRPDREAANEGARHDLGRHTQIGADHEQRAVRQIHEVHDAESQRQTGGHQEEDNPELYTVQDLLEKQHAYVLRRLSVLRNLQEL